jgi:hypothetical protein
VERGPVAILGRLDVDAGPGDAEDEAVEALAVVKTLVVV